MSNSDYNYIKALEKIYCIPKNFNGGDWDEIEEAQDIALDELPDLPSCVFDNEETECRETYTGAYGSKPINSIHKSELNDTFYPNLLRWFSRCDGELIYSYYKEE